MDIPKLSKAIECCLKRRCDYECPYYKEFHCATCLNDDIQMALNRLEFLEKPTKDEQPHLPGIETLNI